MDGIGYAFFRLAAGYCSCDFIVGHARHGDRLFSERTEFWEVIGKIISNRKQVEKFHLILLFDANVSLGSVSFAYIWDRGFCKQCDNGFLMHQVLRKHRVFLPSTFGDLHSGSDCTFTLPNGVNARRDYIAVFLCFRNNVYASYVDSDFVVATIRDDHSAVVCQLTFGTVRNDKIRRSSR